MIATIPATKIKFSIPQDLGDKNISLTIFDVLGNEVSKLTEGKLNAGDHEIEWNAENIKNRGLKMIEFLWSKLHPNQPNVMTINEKYELLGLDFLNKTVPVGQTNSN